MAKKTKAGKPVKTKKKSEPAPKVRGLNIGMKTGLNLTHFINKMFSDEVRKAKAKRLPDETLEKMLKAEFPKRSSFQSISAYRGYFNAGAHGHGYGKPPVALPKEKRLRKVK